MEKLENLHWELVPPAAEYNVDRVERLVLVIASAAAAAAVDVYWWLVGVIIVPTVVDPMGGQW